MSPRPTPASPGRKLRGHLSRRLVLVVALAVVAALGLPGAAAGAESATGAEKTTGAGKSVRAAGLAGRYVALGDSYAAGPGIPRLRLESGLCARSTGNYPTLVAAALAPSAFSDVSCSGAETHHMTRGQHNNPPQYSALTPDTLVVTLTIGGNDADFFKILGTCAVGGVLVPKGSPCKKKYTKNGADGLDARIAAAMPKVAEVIRGIHERAPRAVVFVVGYPAILPDAKSKCAMDIPIARGDVPYLNGKIQSFNRGLAAQAVANGALFVDTYAPSVGHEACQTPGVRWIEGIEGVRGAIPIHPNARGMSGMATAVLAAIRAAAVVPAV